MSFEPIIGLEVHVQLNTNTKMFCSCSSKYLNVEPNTFVCNVCLGLPGSLPSGPLQHQPLSLSIPLSPFCAYPDDPGSPPEPPQPFLSPSPSFCACPG